MVDLVQWLTAQLDADAARAHACPGNGEWRADDIAVYGSDLSPEVREHMAAHDPARVLREIESKRALLEPHEPTMNPSIDSDLDNLDDQSTWLPVCSACQSTIAHPGDWPCLPVRLLLAPYSDRPGFREEWSP